MTRFLLDVNVLIALIDPAHVQHDRAREWFVATRAEGLGNLSAHGQPAVGD